MQENEHNNNLVYGYDVASCFWSAAKWKKEQLLYVAKYNSSRLLLDRRDSCCIHQSENSLKMVLKGVCGCSLVEATSNKLPFKSNDAAYCLAHQSVGFLLQEAHHQVGLGETRAA